MFFEEQDKFRCKPHSKEHNSLLAGGVVVVGCGDGYDDDEEPIYKGE